MNNYTEELTTLIETIYKSLENCQDCDESLALVKVLQNVSLSKWHEVSKNLSLESWLALPITSKTSEAIIKVIEQHELLVTQKNQDNLTKIGNRLCFDTTFESELERARQVSSDLSLIIIDIDDFKKVNDTYGHLCGDEVLKKLASVLVSSFRTCDFVFRVGGEEFAVILPQTSYFVAMNLCNKALSSFSKFVFDYEDNKFSVTFSAGVASLGLFSNTTITMETLFKAADEAMYTAKRNNKNCVKSASTSKASTIQNSLVETEEKKLLFSS